MPYYDGDFTVAFRTAERLVYPFRDTADRLYEEDFVQLSTSYVPLTLGIAHTTRAGFYLVEQSSPTPIGGEAGPVVKFTRFWAEIPQRKVRGQLFAFSYPGLRTYDKDIESRRPGTLPVWATRESTFWLTENPESITRPALSQPMVEITKYTLVGGTLIRSGLLDPAYVLWGGTPTADGTDVQPWPWYGWAEVEGAGTVKTVPFNEPDIYTVSVEVNEWRGPIWERVVVTCPKPSFSAR